MLVILIIGVAIIVISSFDTDEGAQTELGVIENYEEEARLSEILSEIEGVGEVSVMISYVSTIEKDIARDSDSGRAVTSGGDVVIKREVYPEVKGVVVIAVGAEKPGIKQAITEAVIAITGVGANRVCVFEKDQDG